MPERFTDSLLEFSGSVRCRDYVCRYRLSPNSVVLASHQCGPDVGKGGDRVLDFLGVDVVGAGVDHSVEARAEVEVSVVIEPGQVPEPAPAVGVGPVGDDHAVAHAQLAPGGVVAGGGPDPQAGLGDRPPAAASVRGTPGR